MASLQFNRGSKRAREAREELGLPESGPLDCVLSAVEDAGGLPVFLLDLPAGYAGAYWCEGETAYAFVNGEQAAVRRRFTLAHEFGHHRLGHAAKLDPVANLTASASDPHEAEANAFAAEFLMPKADVKPWLDDRRPGLDEVVRFAADYGVSAHAALLRFKTAQAVSAKDAGRLQEEIGDSMHLALAAHLGLDDRHDGLTRAQSPRFPPSATAADASRLGAVLAGRATPGDDGPLRDALLQQGL